MAWLIAKLLDASFMHVVEKTTAAFVAIEDSKVAQWGRICISAQKLDTRDPLSPSLDPVVVQSPSAAIVHMFLRVVTRSYRVYSSKRLANK